jgi:phage portal protein BeeE
VDQETAERWIKAIEARHQGSAKAGKIIAVGGGAELVAIPISLADAQFAEATRLTIEQAAGMYQVPLSFAVGGPGSKPPSDTDWRMFLTFALGPVLDAMAQAFSADRDLFDEDLDEEELDVAADPTCC